jgi:hypothetical protein
MNPHAHNKHNTYHGSEHLCTLRVLLGGEFVSIARVGSKLVHDLQISVSDLFFATAAVIVAISSMELIVEFAVFATVLGMKAVIAAKCVQFSRSLT